MDGTIRIEDGAMFLACIAVFAAMDFAWWWFLALILTPDIGMLGYLIDSRWGARIYNVFHNRTLAVAVGLLGWALSDEIVALAGLILFAHASMDRALGYGLKHPDDFRHTHLGWIGDVDEG